MLLPVLLDYHRNYENYDDCQPEQQSVDERFHVLLHVVL